MNKRIQPPQWPLKLLRLFLKKEYHEEIEGDLEEIFYERIEETNSYHKASRAFAWEALLLIRPVLLKSVSKFRVVNQYPMLKNYFKVSLRSFGKSPLTSFINVFGLAVAIGISLVVYSFTEYDRSVDQFHANKNEVFLATFHAKRENGILQ